MFVWKYSLILSSLLLLGLSHCAAGNRKTTDKAPGSPGSTPTPPSPVQSPESKSTPSPGESRSGSTQNIGGVFQLLPTKVANPSEVDDDYCDEESNLGAIIPSTDGGDYRTCLGESLRFAQSSARYYKAFRTPQEFFRPLTGSITIIVTPTSYDWQCYRLPERRSHTGSADTGDSTADLCEDVFAFKIAVPEGANPGRISITFNGGSPEMVDLGSF